MEIISLVVGVITIIWFIIDTKKENSKVLKAILDVQEASLKALTSIEKGQKSGFETMSKALTAIEEGQKSGFEILSKMLLQQTEILARINGKVAR